MDFNYAKNQDPTYFNLLRLAQVSDQTSYLPLELATTVNTLNQLDRYAKIHQRILPLLNAKALKLNIFNELNKSIQQLLTTQTQRGIITELARQQQLKVIIKELSSKNIPIILLKGAAFANVLYSQHAPRTSNDLDILIQKKYWHQAVANIKNVMNYTEKPQPDVFGDLYELSFMPKHKVGAALDLHSSLTHPLLFNIDEQQLWENSIEHPSFNNKLVRTLSPEHALIHQAIHAYKDMDFGKYNLIDSHEIITAQSADIEKAITTAQEWGASKPLFVLLKNCHEIMNTAIEIKAINKTKPAFITQYIMEKLLKSRFTQPIENKKPLRYRINQILGQFVFTGSIKKPLALQWLFIKTLLNK